MRREAEATHLFQEVMHHAGQCGVDVVQFRNKQRFRQHDTGHFYRTALLAGHIAASTPGADFAGAVLGGALHDIGRRCDDDDPDHGVRGAEIVARHELLDPWLDQILNPNIVIFAIQYHPEGRVTDNPTAGAVWDADRIELRRTGVLPDLTRFSTLAGKRLARRGTGAL
jgi:uncharacterized protein